MTLRSALAGLILSLMSVTQSSGGPSPSTGFAAAALLNKLTDAALLSLQAVSISPFSALFLGRTSKIHEKSQDCEVS